MGFSVGFGRSKKPVAAPQQPRRMPVASYYKGREAGTTTSPFRPRPELKKTKRNISQIIDMAVVLAIIFCFIFSLIVKPVPKTVSNSWTYHKSSTYDEFISKRMSGLLDRNKLTFNEQKLINDIEKQFPEVEYATVTMPIIGQKPIIHLKISAPAFIYSSQNVSYILDDKGVVVGTQASLSSISGLPTLIDQASITANIGSKVLSSDSVNFVEQVMAQAKKSKIPVSNIVLPSAAQEMQVRTSDAPYYVKFYFGNDVLIQTGQWIAARGQFAKNNIKPAEYLDVRVPGKVFYK